MYHPVVRGDYYKMGHRYGAVLHKHGFKIPVQTDEKLEFGRKSENEVKRVFPDILEEIKGFADACHGSYEQASAFMFGIGAFKPVPECSVCAVSMVLMWFLGATTTFSTVSKNIRKAT